MALRLYDSATRDARDFVPLEEGRVGIYVCGLTVQSEPHVGHVRSAVNFDVLQRWLRHSGYAVTFIRNVTDIDDKILVKAAEQGRPWYNLAYDMAHELSAAYASLNVQRPTYEPAATGHVPEMVELIGRLVERGHAYPAADDSGDVYFDVGSWPAYGELSGQRVEDMEAAADADPRGKRDPRDFALWKGWKSETEPETASWPSPWGRGRPGWHIECSAMAGKYLGAAFDIHGGGIDLRFPHHENEQAQSRAAGQRFASYWLHNAWITTSGEKMSKSLGNSLLVPNVLERVRGVELRFYLVSAHYRSHVEFSFEALDEAAAGYRRIESFLERAGDLPASGSGSGSGTGTGTGTGTVKEPQLRPIDMEIGAEHVERAQLRLLDQLPAAFVAAMDDDLGTPAAVAAVHDAVREGNRLLAAGDRDRAAEQAGAVRAMLDVLGLDPADPAYAAGTSSAQGRLETAVDTLVAGLLGERDRARAARDYAAADAIRDRIKAAGIEIEDTPSGPRWSI
ncbi:cysteine--tRNA ligase [Nocardioides donggukensis]|uniref:Cysteine--tRNA ligase n=1 Tax=Nocardioides donggukensis TaxID=2774019 RepID=A0A927K1I6_9ACTN|nr:cysteine--tRNA ligase [Nocardioides donggukensis]MBD8868374.1 cysteine--tRNA ligase [Nocardioides donggukensis]